MNKIDLIVQVPFLPAALLKVVQKRQKWMLLFLLPLILLFTGCKKEGYAKEKEMKTPAKMAEVSHEDLVKRGAYLVNSIGCADCHSPKRMGERGPEIIPELHLSGFQATGQLPEMEPAALAKGWMLFNPDLTAGVGPWGVSFAANLTSDETGIGNWSLTQFKTAMTKGKYKGLENARDLLPPMPWQNFAQLSDEDLEAMFAYLKSTKPVSNAVPAPIPPDKLGQLKKS